MEAKEFGAGAAHQLAITACPVGWEEQDFTALTQSPEKCRKVLLFLRGHAEIKRLRAVVDCSLPVCMPGPSWVEAPEDRQLPNRSMGLVSISLSNSNLMSLTYEEKGHDYLARFGEMTGVEFYASHILDYLLLPDNQCQIPLTWSEYIVYFLGTVYYFDGNPTVRSLRKSRRGWYSGCGDPMKLGPNTYAAFELRP
ncbi:MAG: hypothetical protein WCT02_01420 [Candidatus Paceibacterota bacterium]